MKTKRLIVKLYRLLRNLKRNVKEPQIIEMEYLLRIEDLANREVRYKRYNSMDEIVKYVYYDVPLSVPNYNSKNYTLIVRNLATAKEHTLRLKICKLNNCEYDNWHPHELI